MKRWALERYIGYLAVLSLVAMTSGCMTGTPGMRPLNKVLGGSVDPACGPGGCTSGGCADGGCTDGSCGPTAGWGNQAVGSNGGLFSALKRAGGGGDSCGYGYCSGRCGGRCEAASAGRHGALAAFAQQTQNACANGHCGLPVGPSQGAVTYPYYTTRGPRDYLDPNPPSIGP